MRYWSAVMLGLLVLHAISCSYIPQTEQVGVGGKNLPYKTVELIKTNYQVGQFLGRMLAQSHPHDSEPKGPILLASFVNLDNLEQSSSLGRMIPQQIGSALTERGFQVLDVRLRSDTLRIEASKGELALSRELQSIARQQNAYAVLTGTYSRLYGQVYVNAKILKSSSKTALAAKDYYLPYEPGLLHPEGLSGLKDAGSLNIQPSVRTSLE